MAKKRIDPVAGDIFCIPLFLLDEDDRKYQRANYDPDKMFAFGRVIKIQHRQGGAPLIEIFSLTGPLTRFDHESIVASPRLFQPVSTTGTGFGKNRWRVVSHDEDYDPERDSAYSKIRFHGRMKRDGLIPVRPPSGSPVTWVPLEEARQKYFESKWWRTQHLEEKIVECLKEQLLPYE